MTTNAPAGDFTALLNELSTFGESTNLLAKALSDTAEFEMGEDGKPKLGADGKPVRKQAAEGDLMGKAFEVELPGGERAAAVDATDILKALDSDMGTVRKALPQLMGVIKAQGDMIKALGVEVNGLRSQGTGRRSALSVMERPAVTEASAPQKEGMQPGEFMAKALDCVEAGKLSATDASRLDALMARGLQPDRALAAIVFAHKPS